MKSRHLLKILNAGTACCARLAAVLSLSVLLLEIKFQLEEIEFRKTSKIARFRWEKHLFDDYSHSRYSKENLIGSAISEFF
jgi:hypothetical protein